MGRQPKFKERETIGITLEAEELIAFDEIRWREHKDRTKLGREAILEYINAHKEGNDTYKLDKWNEDSDFQAVPALFSHMQKWRKHYEDSDQKSRMDIRIKLNQIRQQIDNVEFNEKAKVKRTGI